MFKPIQCSTFFNLLIIMYVCIRKYILNLKLIFNVELIEVIYLFIFSTAFS